MTNNNDGFVDLESEAIFPKVEVCGKELYDDLGSIVNKEKIKKTVKEHNKNMEGVLKYNDESIVNKIKYNGESLDKLKKEQKTKYQLALAVAKYKGRIKGDVSEIDSEKLNLIISESLMDLKHLSGVYGEKKAGEIMSGKDGINNSITSALEGLFNYRQSEYVSGGVEAKLAKTLNNDEEKNSSRIATEFMKHYANRGNIEELGKDRGLFNKMTGDINQVAGRNTFERYSRELDGYR